MKLIIFSLLFAGFAQKSLAQKIDSIFVNLYTDSLKKGTYNYINVDARMSDGTYQPLDSNQLVFKSDGGQFFGNILWVDAGFKPAKVTITIYRKDNATLVSRFDMYIKLKDGNELPLKTEQQILDDMRKNIKKKGKNNTG